MAAKKQAHQNNIDLTKIYTHRDIGRQKSEQTNKQTERSIRDRGMAEIQAKSLTYHCAK